MAEIVGAVNRNEEAITIAIELDGLDLLDIVARLALHHHSAVLPRETVEFSRLTGQFQGLFVEVDQSFDLLVSCYDCWDQLFLIIIDHLRDDVFRS